MAQGIKALRTVQIGVEASPGGSTDTASTIWRGMGMLADDLEVNFIEEDIGVLSGVDRTVIPTTGGSIELSGAATFEQLPYLFGAGIRRATPTTDSGSGYIYTYTFATTDALGDSDLGTLVIEGGDNAGAEIMRFGFVEEMALTGNAGEAVEASATVKGRAIATTTFTSGLSIPTVETILFSKAKLYIDATSDTIGTTQVSNTLLDATLNVTSGWMGVLTADGRLDFSFAKQVMPEITLDMTFEHNSSAIAEKALWRSETARQIQLKIEGSALTSAGAYTYKTLIINLAGKWETFESIDDKDGNDIVSATFRARYNSTAAKFAQFIVVNELSALP